MLMPTNELVHASRHAIAVSLTEFFTLRASPPAPERPKSFKNLRKINENRVWHLLVSPRRGPKHYYSPGIRPHLCPKQTLQLPAGPPLQAQGEGVGGGVNPSPKGKKGVEQDGLSKPLTPKGLVGFLLAP